MLYSTWLTVGFAAGAGCHPTVRAIHPKGASSVRLRRAATPLCAGLVLLASSACGGSAGIDKAGATEPLSSATSGSTDTTTAGDTVAGPAVAPLTGLADPSGESATRPALSVKLDNAPRARPQAGLEQADVVFEEVVEGGATRFIAVFQSAVPDAVGPTRSVRPMDPNIVGALGGLVAYSGGIPEFKALMEKAPVQDLNIDNLPGAYRRERGRSAPHNLFASPAALWAAAKDGVGAPAPLFEYRAAGEPFGDADAASVRIPYSQYASPSYAWDAASGTWERSQDGGPHLTASGMQIAPANVVVQLVTDRKLRFVDQSGSAVVESIVVGEGDAWVFSGGRVTKGRWSKADAGSATRYTDAAGNPVKLAPGRTWVHYAPVGSAISAG